MKSLSCVVATEAVSIPLPLAGGYFDINFRLASFLRCPALGDDPRELSAMLTKCTIASFDGQSICAVPRKYTHMKVSVVTPSFNQGQFIQRTLESVATQTGAEIEHVVFDGGSTDDTVDVLKRFGNGVKWISEKDKGQTDAVNKGIRATDGEIIGWLNSDDVYYPGAIARVVAFFETHPDVDVVYGMADHIDLSDYAFEAYPTEPWNFRAPEGHLFHLPARSILPQARCRSARPARRKPALLHGL